MFDLCEASAFQKENLMDSSTVVLFHMIDFESLFFCIFLLFKRDSTLDIVLLRSKVEIVAVFHKCGESNKDY